MCLLQKTGMKQPEEAAKGVEVQVALSPMDGYKREVSEEASDGT